jgi:hypothetical protein
MKRRYPVTKEKHEEFICAVQQLLEGFPYDKIIHIDEADWRVVAVGCWTGADTRS